MSYVVTTAVAPLCGDPIYDMSNIPIENCTAIACEMSGSVLRYRDFQGISCQVYNCKKDWKLGTVGTIPYTIYESDIMFQ